MGVLFEQLLIFGGIFLVFWFLVLRPQSKRQKEHTAFISTLKVGTRVVTASGIFGRIAAIDEKTVDLEVAPKTVIKVLRSQVAGLEGRAAEAVENATAR
ncbi:MAG: preprotein translocase subunit YajC [Deltaproteobacteria bacterium]|nr:preprotein translocase subunit YajC [Deltaproteobacteria bacterium]